MYVLVADSLSHLCPRKRVNYVRDAPWIGKTYSSTWTSLIFHCVWRISLIHKIGRKVDHFKWEFSHTPITLVIIERACPSRPISNPNRVHLPISFSLRSEGHGPIGSLYTFSWMFVKPVASMSLLIVFAISKVFPVISPASIKSCLVSEDNSTGDGWCVNG